MKGAFWGLMAGFVTGVTRLILVFVYRAPETCGEEDLRPGLIRNFHYMYFAILLFWITFVVAVVVSLLTEPPTYDQVSIDIHVPVSACYTRSFGAIVVVV